MITAGPASRIANELPRNSPVGMEVVSMNGKNHYSIWLMDSNHASLRRGIDLFNAGRFYEAHEVLEDVWRESIGERKLFLQALVQLAVGFHHYTTDNVIGAQSVLQRGISNLAVYPDECEG